MQNIVIVTDLDPEAELDRLAVHYRAAGGAGMQMLNLLGGQAEGLLDRLPPQLRSGLTVATERALGVAMQAAETSRRTVPDQKPWVNTAVTTAMGAAGGFGGLSTSLLELPATTAMLLRTIQGVAAERGFDPSVENVRFDCVRVFSAAGPLASDDGADLGFLATRLTLTGGALQQLISVIAPRLATVLGQKLAAQTVPVLGAIAGAGTNLVFSRYYQQIAHVHFGLRQLSMDADIPCEELTRRLALRMERLN